jgi:prolyl-tRNA synthetase
MDDSDNSMGWKCSQWEMKGVPLRIEIGPRDIENGVCMAVRRDNGEKVEVQLAELTDRVPQLLDTVQQGLFDKAKKNLDSHIFEAHSLEEAKKLQEEHGGFIKTMWCGDVACEERMKDEAGMSSRCIPFAQEDLGGVCPICGRPAKKMIYWGVAY